MPAPSAPPRDSTRPALTEPATVYAWAAARFAGLPAALFALDAALANVLRTTTQPMVGQMRLTWWHDALGNLDRRVPAHPVLRELAKEALPRGVTPSLLAQVVEGWEALLEEPLDTAAVGRHAMRGEALFAALEGSDAAAVGRAGAGWALADLAAHVAGESVEATARREAEAALAAALADRWADARVTGALALDARLALSGQGAAASPRRALAVLRFRLLGC